MSQSVFVRTFWGLCKYSTHKSFS